MYIIFKNSNNAYQSIDYKTESNLNNTVIVISKYS